MPNAFQTSLLDINASVNLCHWQFEKTTCPTQWILLANMISTAVI